MQTLLDVFCIVIGFLLVIHYAYRIAALHGFTLTSRFDEL